MLTHNLKMGDELWIGETRITLRRRSGQVASLLIDAPPDVRVMTSKPDDAQEASASKDEE